jgi:DNA-binding transcriptional MerR regulator
MRPSKTDLIDLLGRALAGVVPMPPGFLSEVALAERLDLDPRRMRALRRAGVVAPRRLGRGFVYTESEAKLCAVVAALGRLGVEIDEIARFLDGPCPEATCPRTHPACRPHDCCRGLLDRLATRVETEIGALRGFQASLHRAAL